MIVRHVFERKQQAAHVFCGFEQFRGGGGKPNNRLRVFAKNLKDNRAFCVKNYPFVKCLLGFLVVRLPRVYGKFIFVHFVFL